MFGSLLRVDAIRPHGFSAQDLAQQARTALNAAHTFLDECMTTGVTEHVSGMPNSNCFRIRPDQREALLRKITRLSGDRHPLYGADGKEYDLHSCLDLLFAAIAELESGSFSAEEHRERLIEVRLELAGAVADLRSLKASGADAYAAFATGVGEAATRLNAVEIAAATNGATIGRQRSEERSIEIAPSSPTLAELANVLANPQVEPVDVPPNLIPPECDFITPEMLPLVELDAAHIATIARAVPGGARNIQDIYPLAPLQEGVLFHHLLSLPGQDAYTRTTLFCVPSAETLDALIRVLQEIINRHDVLRTAFLWESLPRPVQVVYRRANLPVEELHVRPYSEALKMLRARATSPSQKLDLRTAPLMKLLTARSKENGDWYALLVTHFVCDDNSLEALLSEVASGLDSPAMERPKPPAYRDHIAQIVARARVQDSEEFFSTKLGDVKNPTAPFGLHAVHPDSEQLEEAFLELEPGFARRLRDKASTLHVSTATLFHSAWALVVAHTSDRSDIVYGTVLRDRYQQPGDRDAPAPRALGVFINTLPLRLLLEERSATELIQHTHAELAQLLHHEHFPLVQAQRYSKVSGDLPLFTALISYRHVSQQHAPWREPLGLRLLETHGGTNYPLALVVEDSGSGFTLKVQADRRIRASRIVGYVHTILRSLLIALDEAPQTQALALPMLPDSERQLILRKFGAPGPGYGQSPLLHDRFEEQARRTPTAVALTYDGDSLTYDELNAKANQLAKFLLRHKVGPDRLVGICLDRGPAMIVALLGILKAGGAYVPLDPTYPLERLQWISLDARPTVLITEPCMKEQLLLPDTEVIVLDDHLTEIAQYPKENLDPQSLGLRPEHLAYVIYTSGSTGQPKGVMVEHRNVTQLFASAERCFDFSSRDVWALFHSFAFDFSVWEIWGALLYGGRLVVISSAVSRSPQDFYTHICREGVTILNQTPGAFEQLVEAHTQSPDERHSLRYIFLGGEHLQVNSLERWSQRNGWNKPQLINAYGLTEATVLTTYRYLTATDIEVQLPALIGRPLPWLRIYILDRHLQPVPIGVPGEIYIGGPGVARGYLNRPELTSERFLRDPFNPELRSRIYQTGDLGCWQSDGTIEFLGRNDSQIKLRGHRVELAEIEAQLYRHESVREAVVIARKDTPGEVCLVAYVVPRGPGELAPSLRAHIKSKLPDFMVPSAYVELERMPLTPNGKLDRRALPEPTPSHSATEYIEPRTAMEKTLAAIWQSVLQIERVGTSDNFFELGGHSLLVLKMLTVVKQELSIHPTVAAAYRHSNLGELAEHLQSLASHGPLGVTSDSHESI